MFLQSLVKIIGFAVIAVCAIMAMLLVCGRGEGIARFIARRTSEQERYDVDSITHALLFLSVVFIILEVLNLLFPESIAVPCICAAAGAAAGYFAWKYIHRNARPSFRPDIDNGLPDGKINKESSEVSEERTQHE